MEARRVYFKDNLFSSGETEIKDGNGRTVGTLDLHSMFQSGVTVKGTEGLTGYSGKFRKLSNTWMVFDRSGQEIGALKYKLAFFRKKFAYESHSHGTFMIESPAFSREYVMKSEQDRTAAHFRSISGIFAAGAFELTNDSPLPMEELIVVVMGVHAIQKRQTAAAT